MKSGYIGIGCHVPEPEWMILVKPIIEALIEEVNHYATNLMIYGSAVFDPKAFTKERIQGEFFDEAAIDPYGLEEHLKIRHQPQPLQSGKTIRSIRSTRQRVTPWGSAL
jgi:hypothetical protein